MTRKSAASDRLPPSMIPPANINLDDACFVTNLLVQARGVSDAYEQRVDFILQQLVERLDLKLAVFGAVRRATGAPLPLYARRVSRMSQDELSVMHSYYSNMKAVPDPMVAACMDLMSRRSEPIVARRVDLISNEEWYASAHVCDCRRPGGVDDQILAGAARDASGLYYATSFHRAWGAPAFTPRDRDLIYLLQSSIDWIYADHARQIEGDELIVALTPARLSVLARLLIGDSAKQVATNVGTSVHAVNQQVKAIHKIFGVASRGELLSRCFALKLSPERIVQLRHPVGRTAFPVENDPEFVRPKSRQAPRTRMTATSRRKPR